MHFHLNISAVQVVWTLIFAALLVLLTVLFGRDRARRYRWFTASIVLVALRLLVSRLLFGRMAAIPENAIVLSLAVVGTVANLMVVVELARQGFRGAARAVLAAWTVILLTAGVAVVAYWGPWPAWQTLRAVSLLAALQLMALVTQKGDMLASLLALGLGLLILLFGRRYRAGWRSHTQQIAIGLSTAAISQLAVRGIWQAIATRVTVHSQAEYEHVMNLQTKLYSANNVVYLAVLVWWIAWLWVDEPATAAEESSAGQAPAASQIASSAASGEAPAKEQAADNQH
jgi:hypothetical protein